MATKSELIEKVEILEKLLAISMEYNNPSKNDVDIIWHNVLKIVDDNWDNAWDTREITKSKEDNYYIDREFIENKVDWLVVLLKQYRQVPELEKILTKEINKSNKKYQKLERG